MFTQKCAAFGLFSFAKTPFNPVTHHVNADHIWSEGQWLEAQSLPSCCFRRQESLHLKQKAEESTNLRLSRATSTTTATD